MPDTKKAAGCVDTQAAFKTDSKNDFIPILARSKGAFYRLALWLCSLGVAV